MTKQRRRKLTLRMIETLKRQGRGAIDGLVPASMHSKRTRGALLRRGLLDGYLPTKLGWQTLAELFADETDDARYAETASMMATGAFRLVPRATPGDRGR